MQVQSLCTNCRHNDQVIPPGMEFYHVILPDADMDGEVEKNGDGHASSDPTIWAEVTLRFSSILCIVLYLSIYCEELLTMVTLGI